MKSVKKKLSWQLVYKSINGLEHLFTHLENLPLQGVMFQTFNFLETAHMLKKTKTGKFLSVKTLNETLKLRKRLQNKVMPDQHRYNFVVNSNTRTRTGLTLEQMRHIDLRKSQGANQSQIARERKNEGLSRYAVGRYLKDRETLLHRRSKSR